MAAARTLSSKGRQTRQALADAARTLFAQRGFHGTTLSDITAAAGRSPAVFYRYFTDKEDLLAALADSFLDEVRADRSAPPFDADYFVSVVSAYWKTFKPNIGIMIAVDQLAATEPRFALAQNQFRSFGMDIISASVRRAQEQGRAPDLNADHAALAIALLFEQFTAVCLRPDTAGLGIRISDEEAVHTLSTIWKNTLYGNPKEN